MLKKLLLLFMVFVLAMTVQAQNKLTDSLRQLLSKRHEDTARVLTTIDMALQFRNTHPDSTIYYCEEALALARKIHFKRGEAYAITTTGLALREKGELPESLELQLQALQIAEANNYPIEAAFCYRRIGLVYMDIQDYKTCLYYLFLALHKQETIPYPRGIAIENMNLAMTYEYMNMPDSALYFNEKAEAGKSLIEDLYPEVSRVFGNIYARKGDPVLALHYYNKGIEDGLKLNDYRTVSFIYADAARMFRQLNQVDSSISFARKGVQYGQQASYKKGILFSSLILSDLYEGANPAEALRYFKIAAAAKDSLFGAGNIQTIQALIAKEEDRQKEVEFAKIAYQNRLRQVGLLTGLGVILLVALLLYRNNRQQQQANRVLQETLTDLRSAQAQLIQSEKMASLGELTAGIAHEIQNPLNFVNNFAELNIELGDELKAAAEAGDKGEVMNLAIDIQANAEKINQHGKRAEGIVKSMLLHAQSGAGKKAETDLNALAGEYFRLAYNGMRSKDSSFQARMETDFDQTIGSINIIAQDLGRVILNICNNAFYAVQERRKKQADGYDPVVSLSTKKQGRTVFIYIEDNGEGIPAKVVDKIFQPFFTTKPTGQGTGLGLSLAYDIVKAQGGTIQVTTREGAGTRFVVEIPIS